MLSVEAMCQFLLQSVQWFRGETRIIKRGSLPIHHHLLLVPAPRQMLSRLEQSVYCCRPTWGRWRGGSEVEDKENYTALAFIKQLLTCTYRVPLKSRTTFYRNSWLGRKTIRSVGFKRFITLGLSAPFVFTLTTLILGTIYCYYIDTFW